MNYFSNITRSDRDPKLLRSGPSSLGTTDRIGRALGWFSLGLGLVELVAPRLITRTLGMQGKEGLVRAYGAREIGAGALSLSVDKDVGLWSRVAGDGIDIATLLAAYHRGNPKRHNVELALAMVVGVTVLDIVGAQGVTSRHRRASDNWRNYGNRSGFPQGIERARGAAAKRTPSDMKAAPATA